MWPVWERASVMAASVAIWPTRTPRRSGAEAPEVDEGGDVMSNAPPLWSLTSCAMEMTSARSRGMGCQSVDRLWLKRERSEVGR